MDSKQCMEKGYTPILPFIW